MALQQKTYCTSVKAGKTKYYVPISVYMCAPKTDPSFFVAELLKADVPGEIINFAISKTLQYYQAQRLGKQVVKKVSGTAAKKDLVCAWVDQQPVEVQRQFQADLFTAIKAGTETAFFTSLAEKHDLLPKSEYVVDVLKTVKPERAAVLNKEYNEFFKKTLGYTEALKSIGFEVGTDEE